MIRLTIKGSLDHALRAAQARDITLLKPYISRFGATETFASARNADHSKIVKWFCEDPGPSIPGRGYADGTLLLYSLNREVPLERIE